MIFSLLIGAVVGLLMFVLSWMASGLLNDGAKWIARTLVRGRVQRLPRQLRADYTEMWLAEVEAKEPPTALFFAVLLYSPWSLGQELKPLATASSAAEVLPSDGDPSRVHRGIGGGAATPNEQDGSDEILVKYFSRRSAEMRRSLAVSRAISPPALSSRN